MLYITDIRWKRAILELVFTCDEGDDDQLYLYRVKEHRFLPFQIEDEEGGENGGYSDGGTRKVARFNITLAGGREVLPKGQWIVARRIDDADLVSLDALLTARPHLRARMERDVRRHHKGEFPSVEFEDEDDEEAVQAVDLERERLVQELVQEEGLSYVQENPCDTYGIMYDPALLENIDQCSRFFHYAKSTYVYTVALNVKQSAEGGLFVVLDTEFYVRNKTPEKRRHSKRYAEKRVFNAVFRAFSALRHRTGERILFFKQNGSGPTENMAALQTRLHERGLDDQFEVRERYHDVFAHKQRLRDLPAWLEDLWLIAGASYIFIDDYTPVFDFIDLDDGVVLTQLWHAGVGFKSVGYARFGIQGSPDPNSSSHRAYTYALVGNEHLRGIYSEVFGIEPEALLATGMPRLDHFLDEGTAEAARADLYGRYPQLKGARVILFAPTFRGAGQRSAHYPYGLLDVEALHRMCEETNSYFIYEMHHFIKERPHIAPEFQDRVLDLTDENLDELFHVGDVLITDYSSCFYDYLLLEKPVILYVPDKTAYAATRGIQRPIDEMAPGEVCETFDELLESLYTRRYETVAPKALTIDRAAERSGLASDRVIDTILLGRDVPGVRME